MGEMEKRAQVVNVMGMDFEIVVKSELDKWINELND